jgi:hypothetical protein
VPDVTRPSACLLCADRAHTVSMTDSPSTYSDLWVCTDCHFAHHYGFTAMVRDESGQLWGPFSSEDRADMAGTEFVWFAGESDEPADREPLGRVHDRELADNTCSNHDVETGPCPSCDGVDYEDGIEAFSWSTCQGCGSTLGGARYRLAGWDS